MLTCDSCSGRAVYTRRSRSILRTTESARRFCKSCFSQSVQDRVFAAIREYDMITSGDRLLLCVSGEKDSTVMLHIVHKYVEEYLENVDVFVLNVNEGISDYRDRCEELVKQHAEELGLPFIARRFEQDHGMSLDAIFRRRGSDDYRMCNYCCSLRGQSVRSVAKDLDITVMATGMTMNDGVEHAIMCLMKGSIDRAGLAVYVPDASGMRVISPMFGITGLECGLYARLNGIAILNEDCTYCGEHLRDDIAEALNMIEDRNPGILLHLYSGYVRLANTDSSSTQHATSEMAGWVAE